MSAQPAQLPALPDRHTPAVRTDVPEAMADRLALAEQLCRSGLMPDHLRGKPHEVLAIQFAAAALDIPLWQATQELHVVKGRVGMSASLMRALAVSRGHQFLIVNSSDTAAVVRVHRRGEAEARPDVAFTLAEAAAASYVHLDSEGRPRARSSKGEVLPWEAATADMLVARASTRAARRDLPDVLCGITYDPDELCYAAADEPAPPAPASSPAITSGPAPAPADEPVEGELVAEPASPAALLASLVEVTNTAGFRDAWKQAKRAGWADQLYGGKAVYAHITDAQKARAAGESWSPPDPSGPEAAPEEPEEGPEPPADVPAPDAPAAVPEAAEAPPEPPSAASWPETAAPGGDDA